MKTQAVHSNNAISFQSGRTGKASSEIRQAIVQNSHSARKLISKSEPEPTVPQRTLRQRIWDWLQEPLGGYYRSGY